MNTTAKRKKLFAYGIIAMLMGIIFILYGFLNYHNAICNCPAQIGNMPSIQCNCINQYAVDSIFSGVLILSIGIWWVRLGARE